MSVCSQIVEKVVREKLTDFDLYVNDEHSNDDFRVFCCDNARIVDGKVIVRIRNIFMSCDSATIPCLNKEDSIEIDIETCELLKDMPLDQDRDGYFSSGLTFSTFI